VGKIINLIFSNVKNQPFKSGGSQLAKAIISSVFKFLSGASIAENSSHNILFQH